MFNCFKDVSVVFVITGMLYEMLKNEDIFLKLAVLSTFVR
jgi:hypothetical protein